MLDRVEKIVREIKEIYPEIDDRTELDIKQRLNVLLEEFGVSEEEALKTISQYLRIVKGLHPVPQLTPIGEINKEGEWINVKGKVIRLFDASSPSVAQAGLIGDETGIIKFVIWAKSGLPPVEEGKCYIFKNVVVDKFRDQFQINLPRTSSIEEIDEDIQVKENVVDVVGIVVNFLSGCGLIRRCPECRRVLRGDTCPEHGKVKPVDDLRVKAVLDDGKKTYDILLDEERIKELTGIDLEKAKEMAREALDRSVVEDTLKETMICKYFKVKGREVGRFLLISEIRRISDQEVKELIKEIVQRPS